MLKQFILAVTFISASAHASYDGPLLSKLTRSGYVAQGYANFTQCDIYNNKVILTLSAEGAQVIQIRNVTLTGNFDKLIEDASKAEIKTGIAPMDATTYLYIATKVNTRGIPQQIDLGKSVGNGKVTENFSPGAIALRNIIDMVCK